jgi:hypothetical protein
VDDIKKLMAACHIPPDRVHIVMGNHDVTWEFGRKDIAPLLRKDYDENGGTLGADRLKSLEQSQHKFYKVYEDICIRKPKPYHNFTPEADFNIICLNTALASSGKGEDGKLIVGMSLVQKALEGIDASKPGIVLAHHGFESLLLREQEQLEIKLKDSGALLYLCGHEHLAGCRNISSMRETQPLLAYICGTELDKRSNNQPAEMVIFLGELDTEERCGHVQGFEWNKRGEAWFPYSLLSYKQTGATDGRHYFPKPPEGMAFAPCAKEAAMDKYREYLKGDCQ